MRALKKGPSKNPSDKTVGEIVADDYRTAAVFETFGLDFCCGGKVPLAAACAEKGVSLAAMTKALAAARSAPAGRRLDFAAWEPPFLVDYIINTHHAFLKERTSPIAACARKVAAVHGTRHPEVIEIARIFDGIAVDMAAHLREEEDVFFPAVKRAHAAGKRSSAPDTKDAATIKTSLKKLGREHEELGDSVHTIRRLAGDYSVPGDACNTFVVAYRNLKEFEDDLHKHVHLENNILFLKAARL